MNNLLITTHSFTQICASVNANNVIDLTINSADEEKMDVIDLTLDDDDEKQPSNPSNNEVAGRVFDARNIGRGGSVKDLKLWDGMMSNKQRYRIYERGVATAVAAKVRQENSNVVYGLKHQDAPAATYSNGIRMKNMKNTNISKKRSRQSKEGKNQIAEPKENSLGTLTLNGNAIAIAGSNKNRNYARCFQSPTLNSDTIKKIGSPDAKSDRKSSKLTIVDGNSFKRIRPYITPIMKEGKNCRKQFSSIQNMTNINKEVESPEMITELDEMNPKRKSLNDDSISNTGPHAVPITTANTNSSTALSLKQVTATILEHLSRIDIQKRGRYVLSSQAMTWPLLYNPISIEVEDAILPILCKSKGERGMMWQQGKQRINEAKYVCAQVCSK